MENEIGIYRVPYPDILQAYKRVYNYVSGGDPETKELTLKVPGMSYSDFTRAGVPAVSTIAKIFEKGIRVIQVPFSMKLSQKGTQIVVVGQIVNVSPYFHQRVRVRFPMLITARLVYVGSASYTFLYELKDEEIGDVLMTSYRTFSSSDPLTGRSFKISDDLREEMMEFLHNGENQKVQLLSNFPSQPTNGFKDVVTVRHSDTDRLYHSNQASYFNYFMDTATEATKRGHFRVLKGDLMSYRVQTLECLYKGESFPGDELQCCVWENQEKPGELFCQIEKKGKITWIGKLIFRLPLSAISRL